MKSNLVDIPMIIHHETFMAILASDDGDKKRAVWLPKSMIEIDRSRKGVVIVIMPERLAIDKKLV